MQLSNHWWWIVCECYCLLNVALAQYGQPNLGVDSAPDGSQPGDVPSVPVAPPRVPSIGLPSFGYRPPPPPLRRDSQSVGQCNFDPSVWHLEAQSAIANAVMFDRSTGITCEQCLEKCTQLQYEGSEWICRTLTYDNEWKVCDLFTINGTHQPYFLTEFPSRDYFLYLRAKAIAGQAQAVDGDSIDANVDFNNAKVDFNNANVESTDANVDSTDANVDSVNANIDANNANVNTAYMTEAPATVVDEVAAVEQQQLVPQILVQPVEFESAEVGEYQAVNRNSASKSGQNLCEKQEVANYAMFAGYERVNPGKQTQFIDVRTASECANACDRDQFFSCASAVHTQGGCELSITHTNHKLDDDLVTSENSTYLEKVCLPKIAADEVSRIWSVTPNYILVGHVVEVVDASTLAECLSACQRAQQEYAFVCLSVMWYPSDDNQNCLLNSESHKTQPDVFVSEDQGVKMLYVAPQNVDKSGKKLTNIETILRDEPLDEARNVSSNSSSSISSSYTRWSSCDQSIDGMRYRYLKCKNRKDVRKCKKQSIKCDHKNERITVKSSNDSSSNNSDCLAVRDSHGRKRCPHGIRQLPDGRNVYCMNAIDC